MAPPVGAPLGWAEWAGPGDAGRANWGGSSCRMAPDRPVGVSRAVPRAPVGRWPERRLPVRGAGYRAGEDLVEEVGGFRDVELGVVDDGEAGAVPAGHAAVDAGDLLVGEAPVAAAFGVALQDDVQARQEDDGEQAGADVPLPAAEADDRAVREDRVVEDAGDAVGEEVARGEAAGAAGQAVLRLRVLVPPGLGVGEAGADPLAHVVEADVRGGD